MKELIPVLLAVSVWWLLFFSSFVLGFTVYVQNCTDFLSFTEYGTGAHPERHWNYLSTSKVHRNKDVLHKQVLGRKSSCIYTTGKVSLAGIGEGAV